MLASSKGWPRAANIGWMKAGNDRLAVMDDSLVVVRPMPWVFLRRDDGLGFSGGSFRLRGKRQPVALSASARLCCNASTRLITGTGWLAGAATISWPATLASISCVSLARVAVLVLGQIEFLGRAFGHERAQ